MSIMKSLKLSDKTRASSLTSPIERKRQKLIDKIDQQIKHAEAEQKGELYTYDALRYVTDPATQERKRQSVSVKVRAWYWRDMAGTYFLSLRYGNKKLELAKGKTAIEIGERANLIPTLTKLADATREGELDGFIEPLAVFGKGAK